MINSARTSKVKTQRTGGKAKLVGRLLYWCWFGMPVGKTYDEAFCL